MLIKKLIIFILFFIGPLMIRGAEVNMYDGKGHLHFNYKASELAPKEKAARLDLEAALTKIANIPARERNFENTLLAYEEALDTYGDALGQAGFLAYVSTDEELRNAALEQAQIISAYMVEVATRRDIYKAFKELEELKPNLPKIEAKMLKDTMIGFKKSGLALDDKKLEQFKEIAKQKSVNSINFSKNIRDYKDYLDVTEEELEGLPQDYKNKLQKTDGKYRITLDYPDYVPFMLNAVKEEPRKILEYKYSRRGGKENVKIFEDNLMLRYKSARLLGYKNHAENRLDTRMAKNVKNVTTFLKDLEKKLKPLAKKEQKEFLKLKEEKTGVKSTVLEPYESGYWINLHKKLNYNIDPEIIKEFFQTDIVIKNMFEIFGNLFGVNFKEVKIPVWHESVKSYEVIDNDSKKVIGYIYMDLFPRDGKYKHAACFDLVEGKLLKDGTYQKPFTSIVANLNPPTKETPSLLKHSEVETLFHEFGHVLHNVLTEAKYSSISGTSVSQDFVEVPSQILENWAWEPTVLKQISKHYKTGKSLDDETINKMLAAKNHAAANFYIRQNFLAQIDIKYHTLTRPADTTEMWAKYAKKIKLTPMTKDTYPQASFDHLMGGYDAGYYGYLWAEVIAQDFFSEFQKHGLFNKEIGKKFRKEILAVGGSYDEEELVQNFLGRKISNEPFLKHIGLGTNQN